MTKAGLFQENDLVMISALQHLLFCPRQCALIHVEQQWVENRYTAEGRILHERVHKYGKESRKMMRTEFDTPIRSMQLGLIGRADIVEFHRDDEGTNIWTPFPVEYKRGRPKKDRSDQVQLCAQAICLEEMLGVEVAEGALYYGKKHKRTNIIFDDNLREITRQTACALHLLCRNGLTPPPEYSKKCESCSFIDFCMPKLLNKPQSITNYLKKLEDV